MFLQPTDERRRSGSHYTPRSLTEPIVRTTLEPILERLGEQPTPEQILDLKVCDPAMGSGAFLVEACRYLGDALVKRLGRPRRRPRRSRPTRTRSLYARRLVAQRCLYGVDKNPFAVDLAKLSLWLATLAKDHPFTFLDHALRHGDSLVGLIARADRELPLGAGAAAPARSAASSTQPEAGRAKRAASSRPWATPTTTRAEGPAPRRQPTQALDARPRAPATSSSRPSSPRRRTRSARRCRIAYADMLQRVLEGQATPDSTGRGDRRRCTRAASPSPRSTGRSSSRRSSPARTPASTRSSATRRSRARTRISAGTRDGYPDWLKTLHEESHGNADLVAHFFRRAFNLLRDRRHLRPDRHQHHRPGRHARHRPALDLHTRRHDLRRPQARQVARARRPSSCQRRPRRTRAPLPAPVRPRRPRGRPDHGLPVPRRRPRRPGAARRERRQELPGQLSSSAWASPSTTPTTTGVATPLAEMQRADREGPAERASESSPTSAARRSTTARPTPTAATSSTSAR